MFGAFVLSVRSLYLRSEEDWCDLRESIGDASHFIFPRQPKRLKVLSLTPPNGLDFLPLPTVEIVHLFFHV